MWKRTKSSAKAMSRGRRNTLVIIVLVLLCALAVLDRLIHNENQLQSHSQPRQINSSDILKYHGKTFAVVKVVDGDTLDIDVPDGQYEHTRIRLWGVDTPETDKSPQGAMYFGQEASAFTKELTFGKEAAVFLDEGRDSNRGKYGRLLAYVRLPDGRILNEVLLSEGYAYADLRFEHSFYNKYKLLEAAARSSNKGLWPKVTREQLPDWLQHEKPDFLLEN